MGKQGVNPLKSFIPPLLQIPFFMSMFLGLRGTLLQMKYNLQFVTSLYPFIINAAPQAWQIALLTV